MEGMAEGITILCLIIVFIIYVLVEEFSNKSTIKFMLEKGECKHCGKSDSSNVYLTITNQSYHKSRQDVICNLTCSCGVRRHLHLHHNDSQDKYLYNLAIKFVNNELPWQEEYKAKGDKVREQMLERRYKDEKRAEELGL